MTDTQREVIASGTPSFWRESERLEDTARVMDQLSRGRLEGGKKDELGGKDVSLDEPMDAMRGRGGGLGDNDLVGKNQTVAGGEIGALPQGVAEDGEV